MKNGEHSIRDSFDELYDYAKYHFDQEESSMRTHEYPEYLNQIKDHQALLAELKEYCSRMDAGAEGPIMNLIGFLKNWLLRHTILEDKKYGYFFNSRGLE
jgi:hemerythrin